MTMRYPKRRLWPSFAQIKKNAKRDIKGWVELRGHTASRIRLAVFHIAYMPVVSEATKKVVGHSWTAYVQKKIGTTNLTGTQGLGRFHNPAKALDAIKAAYKPRRKDAVEFGNGSAKKYEAELVESLTDKIAETKNGVVPQQTWVVFRSEQHGGPWSKTAHVTNAKGNLGCAAWKAAAKRRNEDWKKANKMSALRPADHDAKKCGFCKQVVKAAAKKREAVMA